ncbi:MAG: porphobilinogen synthase, partial [Betaproteobacteria bacterium]|nr:porphobilinogen synthase [Betaproteobacteria bacterium]
MSPNHPHPGLHTASFPAYRARRTRKDDWSRRLVREHRLSVDDLIYPTFVIDKHNYEEAVASMPGVSRFSPDRLLAVAEDCVALGIPVMAIFPVIDPAVKTPDGIIATDPEGLIPRTVRMIKARFPTLGVLTDVALDPFTSHGQDGVLDSEGYVLND